MTKKNRFTPLWLALSCVVGIIIGTFYANHLTGNRMSIINAGSNKLNLLLHIVDAQYVDTVNVNEIVEKALPTLLAELDPHSVYISASDKQMADDDLRGSFSGVGIEFTIRHDTLHVQRVIKGGPSETAGLLDGDKIVMVDDSVFTGPTLTNDKAIRRLKGPEGSKVKLSVVRRGEKQLLHFNVVRGQIHTSSVNATYMLDEKTGYIKIKNFGENTYSEFLIALAELSMQNFQSLVIDLRGNTGGYLGTAVQIVNELLPSNKLITYTEGLHSPRQEYRSDGRGSYRDLPLIVLIDESSASASEIVAGAIQDNDRGTVIGRRSFGKGLVQQPIEFGDGSMMRLTIARYYSPSGRCIQKPYDSGMDKSYEEDILQRYQHGEFFSSDSIHHTGPAFHTTIGRTVYGGGGITPDIFVPQDTTNYTSYYREALMTGAIILFAYDYTDQHRPELTKQEDAQQLVKYLRKQNLLEQFVRYGEGIGLKRRNLMIQRSRQLLEHDIYGRIVYNVLADVDYIEYLNHDDPAIIEALRVFRDNAATPQPPAKDHKEKADSTKAASK